MNQRETPREDGSRDAAVETETTHGKGVDPDAVSDPSLATPADREKDDDLAGVDWSSEGGATRQGPATHSGSD